MIRVVLDTNVFISGTFWSGDSYGVLKLVTEGKVKCVISSEIIKEYDRILHSEEILEKTREYEEARVNVIQALIQSSVYVEPKEKLDVIKDDPDDNKFIECALEGRVDYIITKDNHLLKLGEYCDIKILTPEDFLNEISNRDL